MEANSWELCLNRCGFYLPELRVNDGCKLRRRFARVVVEKVLVKEDCGVGDERWLQDG